MPTNVIRHRIHYTGNGIPLSATGFANLQTQDTYFDRDTGKLYRWANTKWSEENNIYGISPSAPPTPPSISVVETLTVAPGTSASVVDVSTDPKEVKLKFSIPKGEKGDPGTSGGGVITTTAFIYVAPSGTDDTAALQAAIASSKSTGKMIILAGTYKISNSILIDKDHKYLVIEGSFSRIVALNSNFDAFIKRINPTNNKEALDVMTNSVFHIRNLVLKGFTNQVGLQMGPSYGSKYEQIWGDSLKTVIHLRFALRTVIDNSFAINCLNGFIADYGNWVDATDFNSQSNHTTITNCRVYFPENITGNVGFGFYSCSGGVVRDCIIEGFKANVGIDFDGKNSNVVKDFTINNIHFECTQGATTAFIKTRIAGGTVTIDKCYGQYPCLFLDSSSTSGLGFVQVSNVPWWVSKNGKLFTTSNVSLDFKYNEAFYDDAYTKDGNPGINPAYWTGTPPRLYGLNGNDGYHCYTVTRIPR